MGPATIPPMTAPVMPPAVCLDTEGRFFSLSGFLDMMFFSGSGVGDSQSWFVGAGRSPCPSSYRIMDASPSDQLAICNQTCDPSAPNCR